MSTLTIAPETPLGLKASVSASRDNGHREARKPIVLIVIDGHRLLHVLDLRASVLDVLRVVAEDPDGARLTLRLRLQDLDSDLGRLCPCFRPFILRF